MESIFEQEFYDRINQEINRKPTNIAQQIREMNRFGDYNKVKGYYVHKNDLQKLNRECQISSIYFLFDNSEVVYIGMSIKPIQRLISHWKDFNKKWEYARVYHIPFSNDKLRFSSVRDVLIDIEREFIRKYLPKYNSCWVKRHEINELWYKSPERQKEIENIYLSL